MVPARISRVFGSIIPRALACGLVAATMAHVGVVTRVDGKMSEDPVGASCQKASFTLVGSMATGRVSAAISTLENGMVLVAGGDDGVISAEVYDPATRSFSTLGSLDGVRCYGCAAQRLADGRVLIVGGWDGQPGSSTAEVYQPTSPTFTPALHALRLDPSIARLNDGRALILGGHNGVTIQDTAELFDAATNSFLATGKMLSPRLAPATALRDGRVIVIGGESNESEYLSSAEIYDASRGAFATSIGSLTVPRYGHQATRLQDGRVLITGGVTGGLTSTQEFVAAAEIYDPVTDSFATTAHPMLTARVNHGTVVLQDGRVLIIGGTGASGALRSTELYDPATDSFSAGPALLESRSGAAVTALPSGEVLVAGGRGADNQPLATAELYGCRVANHQPVADDGTATTNEDTAGAVTLSGADVDSDPLTFSIVAGPKHGGVSGNAPNLVYTPAARYYGTDSFTYTVNDGVVDSEPAMILITVRPRTATSVKSTATVFTFGQSVTFTADVTSSGGAPEGIIRFVDGGTVVLGTAPVDENGHATLTTANVAAGFRSVAAIFDSSEYADSQSSPLTLNVTKVATTTSMTLSSIQRQYSDRVTFTATVTPAGAGNDVPAKSVTFKVGGVEIGTAPVVAGTATLNGPLRGALVIGTKPVQAVFNEVSPNFTVPNVLRSMMVIKEDARAKFLFTGSKTFSTNGDRCNCAVVPISAEIRDISATAEAAGDIDAGDIRNARVYFVNRATGAVVGPVNPTLNDPADPRIGTASINWTINIGTAKSQIVTIGIIVDSPYTRNSPTEDAKITIVKP